MSRERLRLLARFALFWGSLALLLWAFVWLVQTVRGADVPWIDGPFLRALYEIRSPPLTRLALALDVVGGAYALAPLALLLSVALWRHSVRASMFLLSSVLGTIGFNLVSKLYFSRLRPELFDQLTLAPAPGFSFPSGHAMTSMAFALALAGVAARRAWNGRVYLTVALLLFAVAVGLSRSYLQVHYPTDVLAGWALASAWVLGAFRLYVESTREAPLTERHP